MTNNIKVKVCGMNDVHNLRSLLQIPIDFVGFIFYEKSSRFCQLDRRQIKAIWKESETEAQKVGVFVDAPLAYVLKTVKDYELDFVQLHGKESLFYCESLQEEGCKIIKAFSLDDSFCFSNTEAYKYYVDYFLFDTKGLKPGGNGTKFNWDLLTENSFSIPYFLSGGISKKDDRAIREMNCKELFAVDVNSKFEISAGEKNVDEISTFVYKIKKPFPVKEYVNVRR